MILVVVMSENGLLLDGFAVAMNLVSRKSIRMLYPFLAIAISLAMMLVTIMVLVALIELPLHFSSHALDLQSHTPRPISSRGIALRRLHQT